MAITKIHAIKSTLSAAVDYIENPDKTQDQLLVSGYNVDPLSASIEFEMTAALAAELKGNYSRIGGGNNLAYHLIQSFSPEDNVTPETAHEIGKKLADEFLDGKYEYVVSTHVDKGHIHNHIIFNAVSFYNLKKIDTKPYKTAAKIRSISDRLCSDYDLSVIKEKGKLGHSYAEYEKRKTNTSWKSEIRKRLAFVLETATSYDDFKKGALALGVQVNDSGKNIKYQIEGQTRFTRGDKLSDIGTYLKPDILDKVKSNAAYQKLLKEAIQGAASQASDYDNFLTILKNDFSIVCKIDRSGSAIYTINDVNAAKVKERALGAAFHSDAIKTAIHEHRFEFDETRDRNIVDEFNRTVRTKVEEHDTRVILNKENISKISFNGILLEVPDEQGTGKVFIDSNHINFIEGKQEYEIYLGSKYDYYFVNENLDPDVSEKEQLSSKFIKGENLIRNLELLNGVEPEQIEISSLDIKSIGDKGIVLCLPDLGIDSIFIENQYVSYDRQSGGSCNLNIYKNWNYSYRSTQEKENVLKNIVGSELAEQLRNRAVVQDQSLFNRIAAYERRNTLKETKALANTLLLMRKESIGQVTDFDLKIGQLQGQSQEIKEAIKTIHEKNAQYKTAVKYLLAFNKYLPIKQAAAQQGTFTRKKYESRYASELAAFDHAAAQLEKLGVNTNVDPKKVMTLVKDQEGKAAELTETLNELLEKIESFHNAQRVVREVQQSEQDSREEQKVKSKSER